MYRGVRGVRYLSKLVDHEARDQLARLQLARLGSTLERSCEHSALAAAISWSICEI
jgi:hypothetical protein